MTVFAGGYKQSAKKEGSGDLSEIIVCKADPPVSRNLKTGTSQRNNKDGKMTEKAEDFEQVVRESKNGSHKTHRTDAPRCSQEERRGHTNASTHKRKTQVAVSQRS